MVTSAGLDTYQGTVPVVALTPLEFTDWAMGRLRAVWVDGQKVKLPPPWQPGQHVALVGKTREGKTNFVVWLLTACRNYVLALDPKGEDESLTNSGWTRVRTVPGGLAKPKLFSQEWQTWRTIEQAKAEGFPVRIIAGIASRTRAADMANKQLMRDAIEYARQTGGWSLLVDEHQIATDRRMFGLGEDIARTAISAARDGISLLTNMQYLAWVEKAATRQATLCALCRTKDRDLIRAVARVAGRPWQEIQAAVDELPKYWWLIVSDELRAPMLMVRPPKVT
jgi:hypothetical protein